MKFILLALAVLLPAALWLEFPLRAMMLGDDIAAAHGINVPATRLAIIAVVVGLVAAAVCVAGPVPFLAFLSGPIAKLLESGARPSLLSAGLMGAIVLLVADMLARSTPMVQLPTGVFTAVFGAPCLLWLLVAAHRKGARA